MISGGEHVFDGFFVVGAVREVAPVLAGQLPAFEGVALAGAEATQLFLLGDVQPESDEHRALGDQAGFPLDDLWVGASPLVFGGESFDSFHQYSSVPGSIGHRHAAPAWECLGEAVQEVVAALVVRGRTELGYADVPWIKRADQSPDAAAFARGVPSLEQHAERWSEFGAADQAAKLQAPGQEPALRFENALLAFPFTELQLEVSVG